MRSFKQKMLLISGFVIWIQMALVPYITFNGISPDFIFLLIAFYAFEIDYRDILWVAFFLGLCRDLLTHSFFGLETGSLVCGSLLLQYVVAQFNRRDHVIILLSIFLFSISVLAFSIVPSLLEIDSIRIAVIFPRILLISLYTSILALGAFPMFRWLFGIRAPERQYELF